MLPMQTIKTLSFAFEINGLGSVFLNGNTVFFGRK